ncbi:MAG: tetratricopeptide repeat protein [Hungatella sp.]|nr:tetratricopeptide repeat protein [Hungatella sp.]
MNCWEILGIGKTGDEEIIRKAYLKLLPQFHPEENPEGFKALRQAMEEAVRHAASAKRQQEAEEGGFKQTPLMDSQEIRQVVKGAEELYRDFGKRIQPNLWSQLTSCAVCQDLETQKEAGWALIGFLMDHIHVPHSCLKALDQVFGWQEAEEELRLHFPEGFVDYLTERIEEEDSFRYDRTPVREDFDYESFFEGYFELRSALDEKERERVEEALKKLEDMEMDHPDLAILKIRHYSMIQGMEGKVWEIARQLYETDGDYGPTRYWYIRSAMETEPVSVSSEHLDELSEALVKEFPDSPGYWQLRGAFLKSQNCLEKALMAFYRARDLGRGRWDYLEEQIVHTAEALSKRLEEEGCEDLWAMANICWEGERYDKVRELLGQIEPSDEQKTDWFYMMAESCRHLEAYEEAVRYRKVIWDTCPDTERPVGLYLDLAEDLRRAGELDGARDVYEQAAERFSDVQEIYCGLARVLEQKGLRDEAADMCARALEEGFDRDTFNLRMELLLDLEEYEQVREEAGNLIRQGYQAAQVLYDYAKALRELECYDEAEEVLKKLYAQTDGSDMVCEEYAFLCYDGDRTEEALRWVEEALEKRDTLRRQYLKGSCLHDLKRYEEEIRVYRYMMEKGADDYYIDYRMGRAVEESGDFPEAEIYFRRSLEKSSESVLAWDGLGDVLQKQGKWQEAVEAYEQGAERGYLQSARDFCRLLKRLHEDEKARGAMEKYLKKWPEDGSLLLLYSDILLRMKEYEEAVRCLNRYIEVKPSMTERGYREIAECYERAKDLQKAREYYQKAIDTSPSSARCWRLMGKFLANVVKDQDQALPYLEKSVELAPDSTYGYMKLGEVYEALGRDREAAACYEKSLENYQEDIRKDPEDCCNYEGAADVLVHLGRLDEAEEMAHKAISLECRVFTCSCPFCYEGREDLAKAEEKKGNLKKALEWMREAGRLASTDYYPKEIARLEKAVEENRQS